MRYIYPPSYMEELSDKEYRALVKMYVRTGFIENIDAKRNINYSSYPEYKDLSIKQLITLRDTCQDHETKYRLHKEIAYRMFCDKINFRINKVFNELPEKTSNLAALSPLDKYDLAPLIDTMSSPNFALIPDKNKRYVLQAIHNRLCEGWGIVPAVVEFDLEKDDVSCGVNMTYQSYTDTLDPCISIPSQSCLFANDMNMEDNPKYYYLKWIWGIVHESVHHFDAYTQDVSTDRKKLTATINNRYQLSQWEYITEDQYDYSLDIEEIEARTKTCRIVYDWYKQGMLPEDIRGNLILFGAVKDAYSHFRKNGRNWLGFVKELRQHMTMNSQQYLAMNDVLTQFDPQEEFDKWIDAYLKDLHQDFVFIQQLYRDQLRIVYNYVKTYYKKHPTYVKKTKQDYYIFDFKTTQQQLNNKRRYLGHVFLSDVVNVYEAEELIDCACNILTHELSLHPQYKHDHVKPYVNLEKVINPLAEDLERIDKKKKKQYKKLATMLDLYISKKEAEETNPQEEKDLSE